MKPGCANRGGDGRLSLSGAAQEPAPQVSWVHFESCLHRPGWKPVAWGSLSWWPGTPPHPRLWRCCRHRTITILMAVESHNTQFTAWKQAPQCYSTRSRWAASVLRAQSCPTLRHPGLQPARLLCPWDSPGKNTAVGCHALLQGVFSTQGPNLSLLRLLHWPGRFFTTSASI